MHKRQELEDPGRRAMHKTVCFFHVKRLPHFNSNATAPLRIVFMWMYHQTRLTSGLAQIIVNDVNIPYR